MVPSGALPVVLGRDLLHVQVALEVVQQFVVDLAGAVEAEQLFPPRRDGCEDHVVVRLASASEVLGR